MAVFTKRESGKWQAKIRRNGWPDQSKSFSTRSDAEAWARATEREMDIGAFIHRDDAERTTFEVAGARYAREVFPRLASKKQDESRLRLLTAHFGAYSLASISPALISTFRDQRLKAVGAQTVVHDLGLLSRIFKAAALDWGIALPHGIPTALVRKPKISNARDRRLEPHEEPLLLAALKACKTLWPLAIVRLAIETAGRQSELVALKWSEVDTKRRTARLRGKDGGITKGGDDYRDIPLSTAAVEIFDALPRSINGRVFPVSQNALKLSFERARDSARKAHVHARLCAKLIESGMTADEVDAQVRALIYKKKIPQPLTLDIFEKIKVTDKTLTDLHFHDLRHEATSRLADKLQMHELMKVTGHKSSAMLARYYHPRAENLALKLD